MSAGPMEILLVVLVVLLIFGAGRVPVIMENFAKGIRSFKKGLRDEDGESKSVTDKTKD